MICGGFLGLKPEACSNRKRSSSSRLDLKPLQDAEVCRLRKSPKSTNNAIHLKKSRNPISVLISFCKFNEKASWTFNDSRIFGLCSEPGCYQRDVALEIWEDSSITTYGGNSVPKPSRQTDQQTDLPSNRPSHLWNGKQVTLCFTDTIISLNAALLIQSKKSFTAYHNTHAAI